MNVSDAAASGDRIATLCALRDRLAESIDKSTSAMGVASLAKQMQEVLAQIAELAPPVIKDTPLDDARRKFEAKRGTVTEIGSRLQSNG